MKRAFYILVVLCLASAVLAQGKPKLGVGNTPPPLVVAKWEKGTPVSGFEKGKIYVVEFWATWCGPCKVSIPHLSEMARRFKGKVTFTGVSVWERPANQAITQVASFVKQMGDKMSYNVAVDDVNGRMAKTWMEAAGQDGIPAAFVIGRQGKIDWIGHPMNGLDTVLEQEVAGTFDSAAAARKAARDREAQQAMQEVMASVQSAMQRNDTKAAVAAIDGAIAKHPDAEVQLGGFKVSLLMRSNEPAMYAYIRKLGNGAAANDPETLNMLSWMIVDDKSPLKTRNLDLAVSLAERAAKLTKQQNPMILDTLAYALYKKGNVARALELQRLAVSETAKQGAAVDDASKADMKTRLDLYVRKAK